MMNSRARRSSAAIQQRIGDVVPRVAIVLGSGLGDLADRVEQSVSIPYAHVPDMPESTVKGHGGEFVSGHLEGVPVILQRGRVHLYEGHTSASVGTAVRAFAELGVEALIVTNAAGGLNRAMQPPALMLISDHINMMFRSPLAGPVWPNEERFPDMAAPYDPELRDLARSVALERGIRLHEGVYAGVLGPSYETPAEIRMLERLGADAVGMSTVPEVIVARARGLRVLGISSITNQAAGLGQHSLSHDEVLEAGMKVAHDLEVLVRGVVKRI
jgi:purine-nucleoside phosphorylase